MTTIAERVAAGAAFLDEHDPGWWRPDVDRAIDLGTLDFTHGDHCVLGQRNPLPAEKGGLSGYARYGKVLSGIANGDDMWDWWVQYGITAPMDSDMGAVHANLTAEWKRVITERRAAS